MPAGQQVALQPALAEVLAQHLHHAAVRREVVVARRRSRPPRSRSVASNTAPSRLDAVSSGPKSRKRLGVRAHHVAQEAAEHARRLARARRPARARRRRSRGSPAARGRAAARRRWRAGWRPSAARPPGACASSVRDRPAVRRRTAPRAGRSASTPRASRRCSGLSARPGERHLVRAPGALDLDAVDLAGPGPALRRAQHDHRPARPRRSRRLARGAAWIARISSSAPSSAAANAWCIVGRVVARHEARRVAVALEQRAQLVLGDPREHRRVGDLVAVEVQDRQHRAVAPRVEELVRVPARRERARSPPRRRRRRSRRPGRGCRTRPRRRASARSRARRPRGSSPASRAPRGWGSPPGNENCRNSRAHALPRPA